MGSVRCASKRVCRGRGVAFAWLLMLPAATAVQGVEPCVQSPSSASALGRSTGHTARYREHVHSTEPDRPPRPSSTAAPAPAGKAPAPRAVTVREPGPDLANLPNSSYTLPEGGIYLEMSPFTMQGASSDSVKQYNWEFLFRYGLTDDVELRLFTQGLTVQGPPQSATGFSPITFDTKVHLDQGDLGYFNYSVGLESYVQTTWGSPVFSNGTQGSLMLNADHVLPWDIALNWNFGFASLKDFRGAEVILPSLQWAFQRDIVDDFALFIQGYVNAAALPRTLHAGAVGPVKNLQEHAIGAGFQWTVNDRIAVFGSYTGALGAYVPSYLGTMGLAIAF